jgi:outer membrane protein
MRTSEVLLLACLITVMAAGAVELSVEDAVDRALTVDRGYEATRVRTQGYRDTLIAARGAFVPKLDLSASAIKNFGLANIEIPAGTFGPDSPAVEFPMGFDESAEMGVTLTQPIYLAGYEWAGLNLAHRLIDLGVEEERGAREGVIYDTVNLYYGLLLAEESLRVAETGLAVATSHYLSAEDRYDAGLVSEYDVLRARVEVSNLETERDRASDGVEAATRALRNQLQLGEDEDVVLTDRMEFELELFDLDQALVDAAERRTELLQFDRNIEVSDAYTDLEKTGDNPTVLFMAGAKLYANALSLDKDEWDDQYNVMLNLSWPIWDGLVTHGKVKQKESITDALRLEREAAADGIELEVKGIFDALLTAEKAVRTSEETVTMAERGLEIAQARYDYGLMSNLEVMDAQSALTQARLGYSAALYDYNIAKLEMLRATGRIEEAYGY